MSGARLARQLEPPTDDAVAPLHPSVAPNGVDAQDLFEAYAGGFDRVITLSIHS